MQEAVVVLDRAETLSVPGFRQARIKLAKCLDARIPLTTLLLCVLKCFIQFLSFIFFFLSTVLVERVKAEGGEDEAESKESNRK